MMSIMSCSDSFLFVFVKFSYTITSSSWFNTFFALFSFLFLSISYKTPNKLRKISTKLRYPSSDYWNPVYRLHLNLLSLEFFGSDLWGYQLVLHRFQCRCFCWSWRKRRFRRLLFGSSYWKRYKRCP